MNEPFSGDSTANDIPKLALRPREAARALSVSERTLWTWTKSGDVPHIKRGGTTLYAVASLEKWLEEQILSTEARKTP